MAYTNLTTQIITKAGIVPTYTAATLVDGNRFRNTGKEFIHVVNGGAGAVVVTIPTPTSIAGLALEDPTVTVAGGTDKMIGPFQPAYYNNPAGGTDAGDTYVKYDQVTSITVAVLSV